MAIAEYFASCQFECSRTHKGDPTDAATEPLARPPWTLELESDDKLSVGIAFYGFAAAWLVISMFVPYGVWLLNGFNGQAFPVWISTVQITFAPMMACLTFTSVAIALWYVMLIKRFALASAVIFPGQLMLVLGISRLATFDLSAAAEMTLMPVFAYCIASLVVTLPIQMWGGWSLCHARETPKKFPRLGILAIMQLTMIASLVFAIHGVVGDGNLSHEMVVAAIIGFVSTVASTLFTINRLTAGASGRFLATTLALVFAFVAMNLVSLYAYVRYDETISMFNRDQQWIVVVLATMIGTAIYFACLRLGCIWLRACGRKCVASRRNGQCG